MVSPFKIAREAALDKTAGATKFLGEPCSPGCSLMPCHAAPCHWVRRSMARLCTRLLSCWAHALLAGTQHVVSNLPAHPCPPVNLPPVTDELLIWREIGFNLCLHRHHQLHSLAALPQ